ncbi:MAG: sigma-70 family RNA polymerase sigma factor [Gemmatimonadetes bacterium]|nr:sigma-70 family RNA polymerase sigma factor [Gemmatimonadota bacterium]
MPQSKIPSHANPSEVTKLLGQASEGSREAFDLLVPLVYDELRRLAEARLKAERAEHTLNATALVHEAYVQLVAQESVEWQGRAHFFALASRAMRRILINYARARNARKRRRDAVHVDVDAIADSMAEEQAHELVALDDALQDLEHFNERGARIVEYRFFGGLTHKEIGEAMGVSEVTVRRSWRVAKAWLRDVLDPSISLSWPDSTAAAPGGGLAG